ncbi:MAG: N-acetyltransferase [Clostridia bacterium]|nr:N-acetyltransferase [Clostridia bacterium]
MIRLTTHADIPVVLAIFDIARAFMRKNGNFAQWTGEYPGEADVLEDIRRGEGYVIEEDGEVCAVFTLLSRPEPTYAEIFDGNWLTDGSYGTLHRVASNGKLRGVVSQAVDFALQRHSVLRCDTHAVNKPMQIALENAGFVHCGTVHMADGSPRLAFERNVPADSI